MQQLEKPRQGYKLVKSFFGNYEEIPQEWDFITFSDIASIKRGASPRPIEDPRYFGKGRGWIRIGDVSNSYKYLVKTTDYLSELGESKSVPVNEGDLIMSIAATVGKPIILKMKACIHDGFVTFSNLSSDINTEFLFYLLTKIENKLKSLGQHGTQSNLNADLVSRITFAKPTLKEQQKIASILSNVDSLINQTQKIIEQTQRLKKGLMQKLLTKGIGHTKFKTEELGRKFLRYEIPQHWNVSKINEFATVHGRIGWKNLRADEYTDNGPLMLSVWTLVETAPYGVDYKEGINRLSEFRYEESPEIKLQDSDVLVAKDGDIGRIGFVKNLPEPATVNSHVVVVRVFDKSVNPEFLYWYMKAKPFQTYCIAFTSGTTVPLLTQKDLKNTKIPIPPLPEQEKISLILSNFATKIHSLEQKKSKLEALKKGLMQKLLTGQIRVKI